MNFNDKAYLGEQIKLHRKKLGLTQEALAEKVNLSTHHISRIEMGKYTPSLGTFFSIVQVLNMDLELFGYFKSVKKDERKDKLKQEISSASEAELIMYEEVMQVIKRGLQKIKKDFLI